MVLQHGSKMPKRREAQVARAGLAGSALLAEGVSFAGTALALSFAQQHLQASNPVETVTALIDIVSHMGTEGMAVFALTMIFLQIIPIANAFLLTLTAGAIFGVPVGAALCLGCSTIGGASMSSQTCVTHTCMCITVYVRHLHTPFEELLWPSADKRGLDSRVWTGSHAVVFDSSQLWPRGSGGRGEAVKGVRRRRQGTEHRKLQNIAHADHTTACLPRAGKPLEPSLPQPTNSRDAAGLPLLERVACRC